MNRKYKIKMIVDQTWMLAIMVVRMVRFGLYFEEKGKNF